MFCNRYPYTNLHDLNLDWILNVMRSYDDMTVKAEGGPEGVNISIDDEGNRTLTIYSPIFYPENLLDNSYFADPINQRNQTIYQASASPENQNDISGICIDRWRLGANSTMSLSEAGVIITGNCYQILDNAPPLATLIMYDGTNVTYAQIIFDGLPNSEKISGGKIDGKAVVNLTSGFYVWAALLPGNVTDYEYQRKPRQTELVKCLTKMQVYRNIQNTIVTTKSPLFYGVGTNDGRLLVTIPITFAIDNARTRNFVLLVDGQRVPSYQTYFHVYNGNTMIIRTNAIGLTSNSVYSVSLDADAVIDGEPTITF